MTIKEQTIQFVNNLSLPQSDKEIVLKRIGENGVSLEILEQIGALIDEEEKKLLLEAKEQVATFQKNFEKLKKEAQTQEDQKKLEKVRNQIKST